MDYSSCRSSLGKFHFLDNTATTLYILKYGPTKFSNDTMLFDSTEYSIRIRLLVLSLTLAWLSIASFSSATTCFAVILRDDARSDYTISKDSMLPIIFEKMINVLDGMVLVAFSSSLFSIFGVVLVTHPRLLAENSAFPRYFCCIQFFLSLVVLSIGGYIANSVHSYQTLFAEFDGSASRFPYYSIMYSGGIGQAAYGSLVVIMTLVYVTV